MKYSSEVRPRQCSCMHNDFLLVSRMVFSTDGVFLNIDAVRIFQKKQKAKSGRKMSRDLSYRLFFFHGLKLLTYLIIYSLDGLEFRLNALESSMETCA